MKKLLFTLLAGIMVFVMACGPKPMKTDTATATTTVKKEPMATNVKNGYTTKVLNPDLPSPRKEMVGNIDGVNIVINYGSPSVKGRKIWNGLIPYAQVWRTGANEATTIEISKDIKVEGKKLPAGKYGLFTLNNEGSSEVIFNKIHDQWGAYEYDAGKDVLKVIVTPSVTEEIAESMEFRVINNTVMLVWDNVAIPFEVKAA